MKSKCYYLSQPDYLNTKNINTFISTKITDNSYDKTEGDNFSNIVYDYFSEVDEKNYLTSIKTISRNMIIEGSSFYKNISKKELNEYQSYLSVFLFEAFAIYCYKKGFKKDLLDVIYLIKHCGNDELDILLQEVEESYKIFKKIYEISIIETVNFNEVKSNLLNSLQIFFTSNDFEKL